MFFLEFSLNIYYLDILLLDHNQVYLQCVDRLEAFYSGHEVGNRKISKILFYKITFCKCKFISGMDVQVCYVMKSSTGGVEFWVSTL